MVHFVFYVVVFGWHLTPAIHFEAQHLFNVGLDENGDCENKTTL